MASNESGAVSRYLSLEREDSAAVGLFSAHFGTLCKNLSRWSLVFVYALGCRDGALLKLDGKRTRISMRSTLASDP